MQEQATAHNSKTNNTELVRGKSHVLLHMYCTGIWRKENIHMMNDNIHIYIHTLNSYKEEKITSQSFSPRSKGAGTKGGGGGGGRRGVLNRGSTKQLKLCSRECWKTTKTNKQTNKNKKHNTGKQTKKNKKTQTTQPPHLSSQLLKN